MIQIEIARGKGKYKVHEEFEDEGRAQSTWSDLSLEEGQRARLRNGNGEIVDRLTYEQIQAMGSADEEGEDYDDENVSTEDAALERDYPVLDIPDYPNDVLREHPNGVVPLATASNKNRSDAWEQAIDAVNYPVHIVEGYFRKDGDYVRAEGMTNVGRDTAFNFVVADRLRTGDFNPIGVVTNRYGSMPTASVYMDLREYLDKAITGYKLREVYVNGAGGAQQLIIECQSNILIEEDDLHLLLVVDTSNDGSTTHQITMSIWHRSGQYRIPVPTVRKTLSARHTNTLQQRTINFAPSVTAMLDAWNDEIIPLLQFFSETEFDAKMAEEELDRIAEDAGVGKRHRSRLVQTFVEEELKTGSEKVSMYSIYKAASKFIEEDAVSREAADRWRYNLAKTMSKDAKRKRK